MSILIVTSEQLVLCSTGRDACIRQASWSDSRILACIEEHKPAALIFGGVPQALEIARGVRTRNLQWSLPIALFNEARDPSIFRQVCSDDYHSKLRQRIQSLGSTLTKVEVSGGQFVVDRRARQILTGARHFTCSPQEFRLLLFFIEYPGIVFSREELVMRIRSNNSVVDSRIVDVLVRRIRKKIEPSTQIPVSLKTVRGFGYLLETGQDMFIDAESRHGGNIRRPRHPQTLGSLPL